MDMICSNCKRHGIYWKDITKISAYTFCPHCRQIQDAEDDARCVECNELPDDCQCR